MKTLSLVCIAWGMIVLSTAAMALEPPDSLWSRTYGGADNESCYHFEPTADGGYVLVGATRSWGAGNADFWMVKTNANGDSLWSHTFGGSDLDACSRVLPVSTRGYVLAGNTYSFGAGSADFWFVRTDASGDSIESRTYGGSSVESCGSMLPTLGGGYALVGATHSFAVGYDDYWLVKTASNGDSLWSRTYGGPEDAFCSAVLQNADGSFILAGARSAVGVGQRDFWMVKANSNGDSLWSRTYGGPYDDACTAATHTSDGGYTLAGWLEVSTEGNRDFWMVKTSANGDSLWSRTFGGSSNERCNSIHETADGGFILTGYTYSFGAGGYDFWLVRTDANGDSLWSRTFGGNENDHGYETHQTSDGGYITAGYTYSFGAGGGDFWLVKMGPEKPYNLTIWFAALAPGVILRWVAPQTCDYLVYSTTNPNHDGNPPGPDWTLEATLTNQAAGPVSWFDSDAFDESYRNYMVVMSCP